MMIKKVAVTIALIVILCLSFPQSILATSNPGQIYEGEEVLSYRNVTVFAPAVASTGTGYIGVISTITVTIQSNGNGRVFVDTLPLTEVDMQGSARLAVKVASALVENDKECDVDPSAYDYFFVVRTDAPIIGGPSAGAIMTVATVSLLEDSTINNETVMTGMINPDGSIGPIGGIPQKIDAAYSVGAKRFLIPKGQDLYTEMVTYEENGWTVTKPVTKSVTDYAMDNYGIEVVEVEDINEALHNFTGYLFPIAESNGRITVEGYEDAMQPLAESLLIEADELYENASSLFANTSIPNYYFANYRDEINDYLITGGERLDESHAWYDQGMYYASTTKSFQSLIYSRFVYYSCEYYNSENRYSYLTSLVNEISDFHEEKSEIARSATIEGLVSLQCIGAAQKRVSEGEGYLTDASSAINDGDYIAAIYHLASAMERSKSVGWWLQISESFNETVGISEETIEALALDYIEDATQSIIYSDIILQEIGLSSSYLISADELLDSAEEDMKKNYPAAALFEALEALIKANLAIENIDDDAEGKIERAKKRAGSSIIESVNLGMKPVLSISYYEYGDSLVNESEYDSALFYYKYSGMIAGALSYTNFSGGESSSRYVGIPEIDYPTEDNWLVENLNFIVAMLILGGIAGVGIGLIIGGSPGEKGKKSTSKSQKRKRPKHPYFSDDEMPRSIKDYYKKN
jgi:uncharacterized protein